MMSPPVSGWLRPWHDILLVRQHETSKVEYILDETRLHIDVHCRVWVETTSPRPTAASPKPSSIQLSPTTIILSNPAEQRYLEEFQVNSTHISTISATKRWFPMQWIRRRISGHIRFCTHPQHALWPYTGPRSSPQFDPHFQIPSTVFAAANNRWPTKWSITRVCVERDVKFY